ncbi:MAG: protein kinase [Planctomycetes bacterium]|nr:protein kinase [Planctomycetota bacterium]
MTDSRATPPPDETQPGGTPTSAGNAGTGNPGNPGNEISISDQKTQPMPIPAKPTPDFTLPNYEILGKLGQGGMGAVYKARQLSLDRIVAIKVLPQNLAEDRSYAMRLVREGQVLAKISHPNVVTCIDLGEHAGILYVVMEYVEGESLEGCLQRRTTLPLDEALHYLKQSVIGLDHANAMGILHRDIKPGNMLLQRAVKGQTTIKVPGGHSMKIADMGLARFTQEAGDNTRLTQDGMTVGTPNYMSPEQALGEPLDLRTDIYALGITFYLMVTGKLPFAAKNTAAVLAKKLSEQFEDLRTHVPALPPGASLLVQRMTARDKDNRYATYGDLLKDIENLERGRPLEAVILDDADASMSLLPETKEALRAAGQSFTAMGTAKKRESFEKAEAQKQRASGSFAIVAGLVFGLLALAGGAVLVFALMGKRNQKPDRMESDAGKTKTAEQSAAKTEEPIVQTPQPALEAFFESEELVTNSLEKWREVEKSDPDPTFRFETGDNAASLVAMKESYALEHTVPHLRFKLKAKAYLTSRSDRFEIRIPSGEGRYTAVGLRWALESDTAEGYFEVRSAKDHAALQKFDPLPNLSPNDWPSLEFKVAADSIIAGINGKELGKAERKSSGTGTQVQVAAKRAAGQFQTISISYYPPDSP